MTGDPKPLDESTNVLYEGQVYQVIETMVFADWTATLRDQRAKAKIVDRLKRAANGNLGDWKSLKGGVFEMRIDTGPGYRVYYTQRGNQLILLLCGGDKHTQDADIARARRLKEEFERSNGNTTI